MRHFRCRTTRSEVSDDSVGRRGRERAAANHHKNLPANLSAPDEEVSPEVGQPKKASISLGSEIGRNEIRENEILLRSARALTVRRGNRINKKSALARRSSSISL